MSIEGASAELGGGGLRMNAKVVETPATAEEHGHVQLSWSNKGGNISIEKKQGGSWRSIASRASSPVIDSDAAVGEQLYRAKNGRDVVAQIGILVESKDQQSGSMMVLGARRRLAPGLRGRMSGDASRRQVPGVHDLVFQRSALYAGSRSARGARSESSSATPRRHDATATRRPCRTRPVPPWHHRPAGRGTLRPSWRRRSASAAAWVLSVPKQPTPLLARPSF